MARVSRACIVGVVLVVSTASAAAAQSPAEKGVSFHPPARLFSRLFAVQQLPDEDTTGNPAIRERSANRVCAGCQSRPGSTHVLFDSPLVSDEWLAHHTYGSGGTRYGDNVTVADFWYDAVHRRIHSRSAVFHEVDDPADVRLGRAPGTYPNGPDFDSVLGEGTTVGHVGFETWTPNGYGAYFAAMQGAVRDTGTGYLDFATATGESGRTRTGSRYDGEDLIKHVRLHPSGQLEVGFETDPNATPDPLLVVRGNQHVEGMLVVEQAARISGPVTLSGTGGNVPHACSLRQFMGMGRPTSVVGLCAAGELAMTGGGSCSAGTLRGSWPTQSAAGINGWEVRCTENGDHNVYVVCCAQ